MKISSLEKASLAVTAAFLLLTTGYFLGTRSTAVPYRIDAQYAGENTMEFAAAEPSASGQPSESPAGSTLPEPSVSDLPSAEPSAPAAARININTAGAAELAALPGIGEKKAAAIIADRTANGAFRIPEDLTRVKGIGEKTMENLIDLITVS